MRPPVGPPSPAQATADLAELLHPIDPTSFGVRCYRGGGKRAFDLISGTVLGVALFPIAAAVGAVILVAHGSPVLYRQMRVGRDQQLFEMRKFRTMRHDRRLHPDPYPGPDRRHVVPSLADPRLTRFGRALSRSSLDELPQLLNVLAGDMSLVGPRPDLPPRLAAYSTAERARFRVRPGMAGPWQVQVGTTNDLHEYVALDLLYLDRCSFGNDLRLLIRTPAAVVRRIRDRTWGRAR